MKASMKKTLKLMAFAGTGLALTLAIRVVLVLLVVIVPKRTEKASPSFFACLVAWI